LTTLGIGGKFLDLLVPEDGNELSLMMRRIHSEGRSFSVLGGGSNVLVTDEDMETPVILTTSMKSVRINREGERLLVTCGAGVALRDLMAMTLREGWSGLEFAPGIPGTVGGAVVGNAGSRYGTIGQSVHSVRLMRPGGASTEIGGEDIEWGYRMSGLQREELSIVWEVAFSFRESDRNAVLAEAKRSAAIRGMQPVGRRTAGCVFMNPPEDSAGRLLDLAGCKGLSVGGAVVSDIHANFIENAEGASAADVAKLADVCRERVSDIFGVRLRFELKSIGMSLGDCGG
jgi:UDP-N-acetylmuramate dehydrogenase